MDITVTQNFLNNTKLVADLISKSGINKVDTVYDLGAGTGVLTVELAKVAGKVLAVEYDTALYNELVKNTKSLNHVEAIRQDLLKYEVTDNSYKVFSNIPFNITSRLITKLFFGNKSPEVAYIIMQKEAAKRFMGVGEGFLISKLLLPLYEIKIIHEFKPTDFTPTPRVDIVMVSFIKHNTPGIKENEITSYRDFTTYVFLQQKPNLKARLSKIFTYPQILHLYKSCGFTAKTPANEINFENWLLIYNAYRQFVTQDKKNIVAGVYQKYKKNIDNAPVGSRSKIRIIK